MSRNKLIMQLISDLLEIQVHNLGLQDISAMGAALLAGLQEVIFQSVRDLEKLSEENIVFSPDSEDKEIKKTYLKWRKKVELEIQQNKKGSNN